MAPQHLFLHGRVCCVQVSFVGGKRPASHRYQRGYTSERIIIDDRIAGSKKKMIILADLFVGVGDRAVAWLEWLKDCPSLLLSSAL